MRFIVLTIKCLLWGLLIGSIVQSLSLALGITDKIPSTGAVIAFMLSAPGYLTIERSLRTMSTSPHQSYHQPVHCQDCKHLVILEDQSENMRPPYAYCSLNFPITNTLIMEWEPTNATCEKFEEGEPEYY